MNPTKLDTLIEIDVVPYKGVRIGIPKETVEGKQTASPSKADCAIVRRRAYHPRRKTSNFDPSIVTRSAGKSDAASNIFILEVCKIPANKLAWRATKRTNSLSETGYLVFVEFFCTSCHICTRTNSIGIITAKTCGN